MAESSLQPSPVAIPSTTDIAIVGAGVIGLSLARAFKKRYPDLKILLLEKESGLGRHASGRNSGVLHAGLYYKEGTLRAKLCRQGAEDLAAYCEEKNVPFNRCGKVILPVKPTDDSQLEVLYHRGKANGVSLEYIDAHQLKELEPDAYTITGKALWVHSTGTYDQKAVLAQLYQDLVAEGVVIALDAKVEEIHPAKRELKIKGQTVSYGTLVNAAGLQADYVAKTFGIGQDYMVLPFKGIFYEVDPQAGLTIRHHIYPVPDMNMPFLGVHFTTSTYGTVYLGPTAVPAFGRENYRGFEGLDLAETPEILFRLAELYCLNPQGFRHFTHEEAGRYFKPQFVKAAQALVPRLQPEHVIPSQKVGIRPQFLDKKSKQLVMDFLVERGEHSIHVLNAISPAFTSAFAFADFVLDNYFGTVEAERQEQHYATQQ